MLRPVIVVLMFATLKLAGQAAPPRIERFFEASSADDRTAKAALEQIAADWKDSYAAMFVDMARLMRPPRRSALETAERPLTVEDDRGASSPEPSFETLPDLESRGSPIRGDF